MNSAGSARRRCGNAGLRFVEGVQVVTLGTSRWIRAASRLLAVMIVVLLPAVVRAGEAVPTEQDPVREKRAVHLSEQLRCLVCQNQSLAESNAELAIDLRRQIREQIGAGRTDAEIVDFMVQRYGDFVLYRPPVRATTILLWSGPALLLLIGITILVRNVRARRQHSEERALTEEERKQAEFILKGGSERERT